MQLCASRAIVNRLGAVQVLDQFARQFAAASGMCGSETLVATGGKGRNSGNPGAIRPY